MCTIKSAARYLQYCDFSMSFSDETFRGVAFREGLCYLHAMYRKTHLKNTQPAHKDYLVKCTYNYYCHVYPKEDLAYVHNPQFINYVATLFFQISG